MEKYLINVLLHNIILIYNYSVGDKMNVYDYIDNIGIYSFEEKEFNEVDAAVFSFVAYSSLKLVFKKDKMKINELGRINVGIFKYEDNNVIAVREGNKLLNYIKDTKRYRNCLLSKFEIDENKDIQFCAVSIEYKKNHVFVSYEGTNELFSGWKENLLLSCEFPTKSHLKAISYLNRNYTFSNKKLIIGGHSKGGNLALVAAMYANLFVKRKIEFVYNLDGPGLLDKQFNSKHFQSILNKYVHIIPDYSVVGMFLENSNEVVVKAQTRSVYCHNIKYWEINKKYNFTKTKLSSYSKEIKREIKSWLEKYNNQDKMALIDNLFYILDQANITSILELKQENKKVIDLIYETKALTYKTKEMLEGLIKIIIKSYSYSTYNELKVKIKDVLDFKS